MGLRQKHLFSLVQTKFLLIKDKSINKAQNTFIATKDRNFQHGFFQ